MKAANDNYVQTDQRARNQNAAWKLLGVGAAGLAVTANHVYLRYQNVMEDLRWAELTRPIAGDNAYSFGREIRGLPIGAGYENAVLNLDLVVGTMATMPGIVGVIGGLTLLYSHAKK
jgi:hypothetical protein